MNSTSSSPSAKRIVAIIQARMGSERLPGKVLADVGGMPMLARVARRTKRARSLDLVVVATTQEPADDAVVEACKRYGLECFRGAAADVLDRFINAARAYQAEVIVRITADCPLIDPALIDQTVQAMLDAGARFAANRLPGDRTFPVGLDVEVCTREALEQAGRYAKTQEQREHVMPYLYQEAPEDEIALVRHNEDLSHLRWTVDEAADLDLVRRIYAAFGGSDEFTWQEVLTLVSSDSAFQELNAHVQQRGLET